MKSLKACTKAWAILFLSFLRREISILLNESLTVTIHNDKSKNTYQRRSSSHLTTDYQNIARLFHSVSVCVSAGSYVKIQPAGPVRFSVSNLSFGEEQCPLKMLTVTLSWVTAQDWALLTETFEISQVPCSVTLCPSWTSVYLGSVAAIFPAAIPQGSQGSQALWRSHQTVDRKKQHNTYYHLVYKT